MLLHRLERQPGRCRIGEQVRCQAQRLQLPAHGSAQHQRHGGLHGRREVVQEAAVQRVLVFPRGRCSRAGRCRAGRGRRRWRSVAGGSARPPRSNPLPTGGSRVRSPPPGPRGRRSTGGTPGKSSAGRASRGSVRLIARQVLQNACPAGLPARHPEVHSPDGQRHVGPIRRATGSPASTSRVSKSERPGMRSSNSPLPAHGGQPGAHGLRLVPVGVDELEKIVGRPGLEVHRAISRPEDALA